MIRSNFDSNVEILHIIFEGVISLEEVVKYIRETKSNKELPKNLKILTDASNAEMNFLPKEIQTLVVENNESLINFDSIKDAIIINGPKETALSLIYKKLSENSKYTFKIFFNPVDALTWICKTEEVETTISL